MGLFNRNKKDDEPIDPEARSPELGVKYKDLALLGQLLQQGADLYKPRHALYYLYFTSRDAAEGGADEGRGAGYACEVRDPLPRVLRAVVARVRTARRGPRPQRRQCC